MKLKLDKAETEEAVDLLHRLRQLLEKGEASRDTFSSLGVLDDTLRNHRLLNHDFVYALAVQDNNPDGEYRMSVHKVAIKTGSHFAEDSGLFVRGFGYMSYGTYCFDSKEVPAMVKAHIASEIDKYNKRAENHQTMSQYHTTLEENYKRRVVACGEVKKVPMYIGDSLLEAHLLVDEEKFV